MDFLNKLSKRRNIKLSEYFKIIHPQYTYLKIIPDTSIRNYNSSTIAKATQSLYRTMLRRIEYDNKCWSIELPMKVSFYIYISKNNVEFYFIVPERFKELMKEKVTEVWNKVTIEETETIPLFPYDAFKYELKYKKEDSLSLCLDKKCNEPLNSILNIVEIMGEKDTIGILYNLMPTTQRGWKKDYENTIEKIKNNRPIYKEKFTLKYILKNIFSSLLNILEDVLSIISEFLNSKKSEKVIPESAITSILSNNKKLTKATINKKNSTIINTQLIVLSKSSDNRMAKNNAIATCEAYNSIDGDNQLEYKRIKTNVNPKDYKFKRVVVNKMSTNECQNFLELPGRNLLKQHKNIQKVDVLESSVPEELQSGTMCIGECEYKGDKKKAYLSTDKEFKNLTLCLIGPTRSGKTTLISNLSRDAINNRETTVLFDYCGNCDLSDDVSSVINKDKILNIDCSNFDNLQGLGYNEIVPMNENPFEVYRCAKAKTTQLMTLINSINTGDSDLRARMERYLEAAAVTVFISNGSIKNVFDVLQDHIIRHKFIEVIPEEQKENLEEYARTLEELDEWSKATKDNPKEVIGTKLSFVQGILNRVAKLKQNTYMELMLKADCSNNINLVDEMQKAQLICIRMPEIMFSTEQEKDIYCTYWLTKIWGALQVRKWNIPDAKNRTKVNIVFDELYQVPNCQEFLRSKLSQIAKFSCKPIISCHYLGQINLIRNELKAANSSYMLIASCDKDNFKELKEELDPYELEDLLNLKRYYSLNLIKYSGGWAKFITHLPPSIK